MKRFLKWLVGGMVALAVSVLAAMQLLASFSEMTDFQLGRNTAPQSLAGKFRALIEFFKPPVRQPEPARFVRTVVPQVPRRVTVADTGTEMTAAELAVKQKLEALLRSGAPTHRLVYDSGKTLTGRLVEEHPDYIVFAEKYGASGAMSIKLPRNRIVSLEPCALQQPVISRRDVRFYMEFPAKHFSKSPPYTIISEESFFAVEHIVKQQQELYAQFGEWFSPLIMASERKDDVQLLIISNADEYSEYRNRYAAELKNGSGFYNSGIDRMVVYHQRDADWVKDGQQQIAAVEKQYAGKLQTEQARQSFEQWRIDTQGQLLAQANDATQSVLRHEGAHQLFFSLGIQNPLQNGRSWVTEGLATCCETEKIGQINPGRIAELKPALADGKLIPLRELMTLPRCESLLAYAEAWSLTCMLMQPEYRSGFFAFLDWLRRNPATPVGDPVQELCRFLSSLPSRDFESSWMAYINQLPFK